MDREGFRNRLKQYKLAREENPGLKYWEWKDIPKYDEGTSNVTYNPIELQRNLQRVLNTTPEGEVNPFYNSLDDTYGTINTPEVVITAPYTRKASLSQQARLGRKAYYDAGKKVAPMLATIPLSAGILGTASTLGWGTTTDLIDVATNPTDPLSYVNKFDIATPLNFNNTPLPRTRKINRDRIAAKRHLGTYNQSTDQISGNIVGELLTDEGTEQFVFNSLRNGNEVFKMPSAYGRKSIDDLFKKSLEYLKFNKVPNFSKVKLEGHVDNGRGILYPIFSQKRLHTLGEDIYSISGKQRWNTEIIPSLDKAMSKYGYKNIDGKYIKGNKIIGDIHPGNIAYDADGNIKLIDAHIDNFAEGGEIGNGFLEQFGNQVYYKPEETSWWSDLKNWWNNMTGMKNYAYGNCATTPDGKHTKECAHYSNSVLRKRGYKNIVGDAWTRAANSGMKKITSGYDGLTKPTVYDENDAKEYLQSAAENFANKVDTTNLKPFDVIGLYYPESPNTEKAFNKGAWNETLTHTGHIAIGKDGTHYVVHNVGGHLKMNKLADMLTLDYDYKPVSAYRPRK